MTLLLIALLSPHPDTITWAGFGWNMLWVSLGNIVAGAGFMALGYWAASRPQLEAARGLATAPGAAD